MDDGFIDGITKKSFEPANQVYIHEDDLRSEAQ